MSNFFAQVNALFDKAAAKLDYEKGLLKQIKIVNSTNTGQTFGSPLEVATLEGSDSGGGNLKVCVAGKGAGAKFPSMAIRGQSVLTDKVFLVWADVDLNNAGCSDTCGGADNQADVDIYVARLSGSTISGSMTVDSGFPKVIVPDPTIGTSAPTSSCPGSPSTAKELCTWSTLTTGRLWTRTIPSSAVQILRFLARISATTIRAP